MQYDNYGYGTYDSNFNRAVNKILVDYEKTIKELNTIINDLELENNDLKNKINELEKEISNEY